jgi:hypothetical protein
MNSRSKISARGLVIKIYLEDLIISELFSVGDKLKEKIQSILDKKLSFKTTVSDIQNENCYLYGNVSFTSEYGDDRVIDFTVAPKKIEFA